MSSDPRKITKKKRNRFGDHKGPDNISYIIVMCEETFYDRYPALKPNEEKIK